MRLPIGSRIGRYVVESLLGMGGMGEVYLARDEELARPVALKILPEMLRQDRDFQQRLRAEARAASALNHPNILTVHEIGEHEGEHFIATEFVDGETLRARIGKISFAELLRIVEHIAEALAAAEAAGIVHRDLKPDNVMIRRDGYIKVLDFGLARRIAPGFDRTRDHAISGTVHYMSPEQIRGQEVDSRSDIWSLGVLLGEAATGQRPFDGDSPFAVIALILDGEPRLSGPPELQAIVRRALARKPEDRFRSMREFAAAIRGLRVHVEAQTNSWSNTVVGNDSGRLSDATPLPAPSSRRRSSNLPLLLTRVVGRDREIEEIRALLSRDDVRLVTLTGPGGTGKTRLVMQIALELMPLYQDGVFFVSLADVTDPAAVPESIAKALGVRLDAGGSLTERLQRELANLELLLILDNLEQLLACGPLLVELLESAPGVAVVATSQAPLHVRGEHEYAVPPLSVPDAEGTRDPESLATNPAVALFVERASSVDARFSLTSDNSAAVAEICRRLDGLPLAIELAAARIKLMSPQTILSRLDNPMKLLTGGSRDLPSRQQTITATIAWGYNLLEENERRLLARLSVFEGGATLSAIEEVCGDDGLDAASGAAALVDRSFLRREERGHGEHRFSMLGTIREFAALRLQESGEEILVRGRHADWAVATAEACEKRLHSDEQREGIDFLEAEHSNLLSALRWLVESGEDVKALRLVAALWWFWYVRGYYSPGRRALDLTLRASGDRAPELTRARALVGAGVLAFLQCEYEIAAQHLHEASRLSHDSGDPVSYATATQYLGSIARERGEYAESLALHQKSLEQWRTLQDRAGIARSLNYIGFASWLSGDPATTRRECRAAMLIFEQLDDVEGIAWSTLNLAAAAFYEGDVEKAMTLSKEALASSRELGFKEGIAWALNILGIACRRRGQPERAQEFLRRSFEYHWDLGDRWRAASVLEGMMGIRADEGDLEKAARLYLASVALRESIGAPVPAAEEPRFRADRDRALNAIEPDRLDALRVVDRFASPPVLIEALFG